MRKVVFGKNAHTSSFLTRVAAAGGYISANDF